MVSYSQMQVKKQERQPVSYIMGSYNEFWNHAVCFCENMDKVVVHLICPIHLFLKARIPCQVQCHITNEGVWPARRINRSSWKLESQLDF